MPRGPAAGRETRLLARSGTPAGGKEGGPGGREVNPWPAGPFAKDMRRTAFLLGILAGCTGSRSKAEPTPQAAPATAEPAPETVKPAPPPDEPSPEPPVENQPKPQPALGKYDPPATLGHLETTPPELRREIDDLVATLLDPQSGREAHEAKVRLAVIGKPAFLPLLGRMAAIRDTITDDDTMEERLLESSLMLADQCLREMDGYLDAKNKGILRPGTDRKYIKYILILHYRRWNDGLSSQPLKDMDEMPGPFDPSKEPPDKE